MKNSTGEGVSLPTLFAIRDARRLTAMEKSFLFVVATRGELFARGDVAADNMGMSRSTFQRTARALEERGLIFARVHPAMNAPTRYTVNASAVLRLVPGGGRGDRAPGQRDRPRVVTVAKQPGQRDHQKRTRKGTSERSSSMTTKKTLTRRKR